MSNNDQTSIRIPPQSSNAEAAVIGCMLIDPKSIPKAFQILNINSFYNSSNSLIFKIMLELFDKNKTIDTISVISELEKKRKLETIGGAYYITGLSSDAPTSENIEYYANLVQEKYILRKIIETSRELSTNAYDSKEDVSSILDKAEKTIFELSQNSQRGHFQSIEPLLHNVMDKLGTSKSEGVSGIATGYYELDKYLSGFQNSDFIVIAGRPSMGKTALALSLARNISIDYGHSVGMFSLEMSNIQLVERLITAEAKVNSHQVRSGKLPKNDWKKLSTAAGPLSEAKLFIDDTPGLNIMEIRAKARRLKLEKDIDILIIDYMQLINGFDKSESRQQEISMISRSLKALAKELDIPVIALSQLSRAPETRTNHRPIMSDLRESGAIEQDADIVLFVYRKFVYSRSEDDKGVGEIIISKHRNGPTGSIEVAFIDSYARFENLTQYDEEFIDELPI
ncbi:MAG: replicative DNA helicase [Candidatus Marinimicrobia bacterium]|nr:replicative DNA helicase [Candidatus Neomarinimicrobiota bacterium]